MSVYVTSSEQRILCRSRSEGRGGGISHTNDELHVYLKLDELYICLHVPETRPRQTAANLALKIASKNCENVGEPMWVTRFDTVVKRSRCLELGGRIKCASVRAVSRTKTRETCDAYTYKEG